MTDAPLHFDKRIRRISRRRRRMARGTDAYIDRNGLIVTRARRRSLPIKGLLLLAIGFIGFKGLLLAHIGPNTYDQRVALLSKGTFVEQAGAWAMQTDPLTEWTAAQIGPVLREARVAAR